MFSYACSQTAAQHPLASFRTPVDGPELEIVRLFCETLPARAPRNRATTVFLEPKIAGCFPDVVIVQWDPAVAAAWVPAREHLESGDTFWLHYLHQVGTLDPAVLCERLGKKRGLQTWERLLAAEVGRQAGDRLRRKPLAETYAIKRLVAVEAKIGNWRRGLEQAFQNTWFASESFLLLNQLEGKDDLFLRAADLGIGLIDPSHSIDDSLVPARCGKHPVSHASWLFNECVWRDGPNTASRH
jgi:hypothetical protein